VKLKKKKRIANKATKECDRLQLQVNTFTEQMQDELDSRNILEQEIQSLKLKVTELETQIRISKSTIDRLENSKEISDRELQSLRVELQDEKSRGQSSSGNIRRSLEQRIKDLTRELDAEIESKAELSRQKRALKRENARLALKLETIEREKNKTSSRYERSQVVAESGGEQSKLLQLKLDDLQEKYATLEKRLSHATLVKDEAVREKEKIERQYLRAEEEIEHYKEIAGGNHSIIPKSEKKTTHIEEKKIEKIELPSQSSTPTSSKSKDLDLVEPISITVDEIVNTKDQGKDIKLDHGDDDIDDELEKQIEREIAEQLEKEKKRQLK